MLEPEPQVRRVFESHFLIGQTKEALTDGWVTISPEIRQDLEQRIEGIRMSTHAHVFPNAGTAIDEDDELRVAEENQEKLRSKLMMRIVSMERQRETDGVYETLSNLRKLAHKADQKHEFVNELQERLAKLCGHDTHETDDEEEEEP